jgi:5-methylcytosine-specific restriction endonuclease McrA
MTPRHKKAIRIFERDGYRCQYCDRKFSEDQPPLHMHRRIFGSQGGTYEDKNVVTCCFECHADHGSLKNKHLFYEKEKTYA